MIIARGTVVQAVFGQNNLGIGVDTLRQSLVIGFLEDQADDEKPQVDPEKFGYSEMQPRVDLIFPHTKDIDNLIEALQILKTSAPAFGGNG